jgi:hypothetical protein
LFSLESIFFVYESVNYFKLDKNDLIQTESIENSQIKFSTVKDNQLQYEYFDASSNKVFSCNYTPVNINPFLDERLNSSKGYDIDQLKYPNYSAESNNEVIHFI